MTTKRSQRRAFTLIEMMIVVTILAMMAAIIVPVITRPYVAEYQTEVVNELIAIQSGIFGQPEQGRFGFLGDVGALSTTNPLTVLAVGASTTAATGLQALVSQNGSALVDFTQPTNSAHLGNSTNSPPDPGVVIGWNGPYFLPHYPQPTVDPWGSPYLFEKGIGTGATDSTHWDVRSYGPDRTPFTVDDIVFPTQTASPVTATSQVMFPSQGTLLVDIWKTNGVGKWPVTASDVSTWGASNQVTLSPVGACSTTSAVNVYSCPAVWFGNHHLHINTPTTTFEQNVAVETPLSYVKVYLKETGTSVVLPGGSGPGTMCKAPSGGPSGDFCQGQAVDFTGPPWNLTSGGSAVVTYSGLITVTSSPAVECMVQAWLDPGTGTPAQLGTLPNPSASPYTVFVGATVAGTQSLPFILTVPVLFPPASAGWKLYATVTVSAGAGACSSSTSEAIASNVVVMAHP